MIRSLTVCLASVALLAGCNSSPETPGAKIAANAQPPAGALDGHKLTARPLPTIATRRPSTESSTPPVAIREWPCLAVECPKPSTAFHIAYADNFAGAFGTQDLTWNGIKTESGHLGCCDNSNERGDMVLAEIHQGPNGLELLCLHQTSPLGRPYSCSGVETSHFNWKPGGGQTFVFEAVYKDPPNECGEDPGWWSTDHVWTDEIDFNEVWDWGECPENPLDMGIPVWIYSTPSSSVRCESGWGKNPLGFDPTADYHIYTTELLGNNELREYLDGKLLCSIAPPSGIKTPWMHLILTHAVREASPGVDTFSSSSWNIRSVAVYEAGSGNVEGGGIAPGTTVGTSEPPKEEPPVTTTTTTPPPPPPPSVPPTPASCTATPHDEGSTAWVSIKAAPSTGATKYLLWRLPKKPTATEAEPWTSGSLPEFSNHIEVTQGHRYAYWIAAENSSGRSGTVACAVFHA